MVYLLSDTNGWTVTKQENSTGLLHIIPETNSIFHEERFVTLTPQMMADIEKGMTDINDLADKHDIYLWICFKAPDCIAEKVIPNPKPNINTENCYQGPAYFVTHEGDKYYFRYLLSRQGGGERKFEISKEIYEDVRKGGMSTPDIFKKYNLYHLDVPENDVKNNL
jgi:hypothetical protein